MEARRWLMAMVCAFPLVVACDSGGGASGGGASGGGVTYVAPGDCNAACDLLSSCLGMEKASCMTGCQEQSGGQGGDGSTEGGATDDAACWACFNYGCSRCEDLRDCVAKDCNIPLSELKECSAGTGTTGQVTSGTPTSPEAQAVGAWSQEASTCSSGSVLTGYAYFLCPGGRIRGGGKLDSATELLCGTYTATPPSMQGCSDKVGCFPKVHATVKDTLILGGQQDVDPSYEFTMLIHDDGGKTSLWKDTKCGDGSSGYIVLGRVAADVSDDYCVSDACPASGGSSGSSSSYGSCNTDCDCGICWYCESGTCRYGGEGPYGCYRGCSG